MYSVIFICTSWETRIDMLMHVAEMICIIKTKYLASQQPKTVWNSDFFWNFGFFRYSSQSHYYSTKWKSRSCGL